MGEIIFFWIFALGAVACAAAVIFPPLPKARKPIHSAIALVGCFFCLAGIYVLLAAHLIAMLQVLVYGGAIMVLFIFVIMLLNLQDHELGEPKITLFKIVSGVVVAMAGFGFVAIFAGDDLLEPLKGDLLKGALSEEQMATFGTLKSVGILLFNKYLLPFELTSILLLVAMVGAVILAKRDPSTTFITEKERSATMAARHGNAQVARRFMRKGSSR
ncbi:MAG: NADH-quinone oxidoreductase subunit J [Bradymonadia bacterium]